MLLSRSATATRKFKNLTPWAWHALRYTHEIFWHRPIPRVFGWRETHQSHVSCFRCLMQHLSSFFWAARQLENPMVVVWASCGLGINDLHLYLVSYPSILIWKCVCLHVNMHHIHRCIYICVCLYIYIYNKHIWIYKHYVRSIEWLSDNTTLPLLSVLLLKKGIQHINLSIISYQSFFPFPSLLQATQS